MSRWFRSIGVTLVALLVNVCLFWSISNASSLTGCGGEIVEASNAKFEQQVVELVNQARNEQGLPPVKFNATLAHAARYLAKDMLLDNYFAHDTYDRTTTELVRVCRWSERIQKYYAVPAAENVANGYPSPTAVVQGWLESQGHRSNILNNYREIGVGYYANYWVQDFGNQSDVYPLIINSEAITTSSVDVALYIYGTWDKIRLRTNDGGWSEWQPFQNQMNWRMEKRLGIQTVEAEMQSGSTFATSRDEIEVTSDLTGEGTVSNSSEMLFLPFLQRQN